MDEELDIEYLSEGPNYLGYLDNVIDSDLDEEEDDSGIIEIGSEIDRSLVSLNILYDNLPKTSGCEKCLEINGEENKDWCCKRMSPSMYYVEFLNVFHKFEKWSHKRKKEVILKAFANYLNNDLEKGCIFYSNGCTIYKQRPTSCRNYGVISEESWNKRWEFLKERDGDKFCGIPQCNLVKSEIPITPELENKWFEHTKKCEERIGILKKEINLHDQQGGTYLTFHDHLLLELFGEEMLVDLTKLRLINHSKEDIDLTIKEIEKNLEKAVSGSV